MGKKAKLKKMRRELKATPKENPNPNPDPSKFIKQVEKTGYRLQNIQRSPEVPKENIEPQL